jgi:hypothetical protein
MTCAVRLTYSDVHVEVGANFEEDWQGPWSHKSLPDLTLYFKNKLIAI